MGGAEPAGRGVEPVEQVGAPHGLVEDDPLGDRLGAAVRAAHEQPELYPYSVFQVNVLQADFEPVPDQRRRLVIGERL